jgi:hypothetical protein
VITVITGPPCSGKTTYAREHAGPGDVIVDFDVIAQALGSAAAHDHDPRLREIAAAAWSAAVDRAAGRTGIAVWIIDARPTPRRRRQYRLARARIVSLGAPAAELHRRADADHRDAEFRHRAIDAFMAAPHGRVATTAHGEAERHGTR